MSLITVQSNTFKQNTQSDKQLINFIGKILKKHYRFILKPTYKSTLLIPKIKQHFTEATHTAIVKVSDYRPAALQG